MDILALMEKVGRVIWFPPIFLAVLTNTFLIIDLYLTLRNPFYPRVKRLKYFYILLTILTVIVLKGYWVADLKFGEPIVFGGQMKSTMQVIFFIMLALSVVGTLLSMVRLS
jgi:hypothetical protein